MTWLGARSRGRLEPERRQLVQHLPLERDGAQHDVEGAHPIGDDERALAVACV